MRNSMNIRTLCASCRAKYWEAGYITKSMHAKVKEECDVCRVRLGWTYIVFPKDNRYQRK